MPGPAICKRGEPSGRPGVIGIMRYFIAIMLAASTCFAAPATTQTSLDEQCQTLLVRWLPRFKKEKLDYLIASPFVIAGDGGIARLKRYEALTIRAATGALQREFFNAKPAEPILILLFESEQPYRRLAKEWLGDNDVSPYGYFRRDNIMVMNVGTGTGTLVHELTHALIKPDFPDVPDWFNEGLGSLFEQCTLDGGKIRGLPNWRLKGLQQMLTRETAPRTLTDLIADNDFYGKPNVGLNYAMARYLLLYLQDQNKLAAFYRELRAHHADDPTGLESLKKTIAPISMSRFNQDWQTWVMKLRFEG